VRSSAPAGGALARRPALRGAGDSPPFARTSSRGGGPATAPLDIRLAAGAAAAWLAVLACAGRPTWVVTGAAGAALLLGIASVTGAARLGRCGHAAGLMASCVAVVLIPLAARQAQARASPVEQLAARRAQVTVELTAGDDPRLLAGTGVAGQPRVAVDAKADRLTVGGRSSTVSGTLLVLAPQAQWRDILPGQRLEADGTLQPALDPSSPGAVLVTYAPPQLLGVPPWWQRAAGAVRADLHTACAGLPIEERGLLPGLVDGDTRDLDPVLAQRFRLAGLTHLVAVSGTKVSLTCFTGEDDYPRPRRSVLPGQR
jgi:competence protein ComEC